MLKRPALGISLILLAPIVLLVSDRNRRINSGHHIPRVAILQHAPTQVLDDAIRGRVEGLAKDGFVEGSTIV